jgi:DNA-binding MarR family transcriptional regulator
MEYSHDDAGLLRQPIGFWAWAAYDAVVTRTGGALAGMGTTQPQWWILAYLARTVGPTARAEVYETLRGYLAVGEEKLAEELATTVSRGWVAEDGEGRVSLTPEGRAFQASAAALQQELWAERHAGITDEAYLTTLKVLQRIIHNTGGKAWHL